MAYASGNGWLVPVRPPQLPAGPSTPRKNQGHESDHSHRLLASRNHGELIKESPSSLASSRLRLAVINIFTRFRIIRVLPQCQHSTFITEEIGRPRAHRRRRFCQFDVYPLLRVAIEKPSTLTVCLG